MVKFTIVDYEGWEAVYKDGELISYIDCLTTEDIIRMCLPEAEVESEDPSEEDWDLVYNTDEPKKRL